MFKTHTTKDGQKMLIAEMDDRHLINTINLHVRKAEQAVGQIEVNAPAYLTSLYNIPNIDAAQAGIIVHDMIVGAYPYLAELWLRDGDNEALTKASKSLQARVRQLLHRDGQKLIFNLFDAPPHDGYGYVIDDYFEEMGGGQLDAGGTENDAPF